MYNLKDIYEIDNNYYYIIFFITYNYGIIIK